MNLLGKKQNRPKYLQPLYANINGNHFPTDAGSLTKLITTDPLPAHIIQHLKPIQDGEHVEWP